VLKILLFFIALAQAQARNCLEHLNLSIGEIYLSHQGASKYEHLEKKALELLISDLSLESLLEAPLSSTYETILAKATDRQLYERTLYVLSHLQAIHAERPIQNYLEWLNFLERSSAEHLSHRIFEGLYALYHRLNSHLAFEFEPSKGFFIDPLSTNTLKSMDLKILDPDSQQTLAYREVKRVGSLAGMTNALRSALEKAKVARKFSGNDVELSVVVFIDLHPDQHDVIYFNDYRAFYEKALDTVAFLESVRTSERIELDSILLVDTATERFIKIYKIQMDGKEVFRTQDGDFPLAF
jgi:hypothetical protein